MDDSYVFLGLNLVREVVFFGEEGELLGDVGGVCFCCCGFVLKLHLLFHVAEEVIGSLGSL